MRESVLGRHGKVIGYYAYEDGKIIVQDEHGRPLAKYDESENKTYDIHGGYLGRGNLLGRFLVDESY